MIVSINSNGQHLPRIAKRGNDSRVTLLKQNIIIKDCCKIKLEYFTNDMNRTWIRQLREQRKRSSLTVSFSLVSVEAQKFFRSPSPYSFAVYYAYIRRISVHVTCPQNHGEGREEQEEHCGVHHK